MRASPNEHDDEHEPPVFRVTRWLFVIFLWVTGLVAMILGLGWMISETVPDTKHKVITGFWGLVVFASSVACFLSARRQIRHLRVRERELPDKKQ